MNRRLLLSVAAVSSFFAVTGIAFADYPLARWVRSSGIEDAAIFRVGLGALDVIVGMHVWYWLAASVFFAAGLIALLPALKVPRRAAIALIVAALVQTACLHTMIVMKDAFGRLRPHQVLESGDWNVIWNAGGGSFPSGHSAFYFGLLLPLAAFATQRWLRIALIVIPVYVVLARIDLAKHFISDVSTSALIAALYSLIAAAILHAAGYRWPTHPSSGRV